MISNCVINSSVDKPSVLSEMFRVLAQEGDPAGHDPNHVRPVLDQIRRRVENLIGNSCLDSRLSK